MNCRLFQRWLDDGMQEQTAHGAHEHAADCADCTEALRVAIELEGLLDAPPAPAPQGFTDRVMTGVAESNRAAAAWRRAQARWSLPAMAWWVEAAAHPATVLAMAVASLVIWQRKGLWTFATDLAAGQMPLPTIPWLAVFERPEVALGIAFGFLPLAALIGWLCYRWCERLVSGRDQVPSLPLGIST